jgi:tetratricopeptide (TPR) repeat protein
MLDTLGYAQHHLGQYTEAIASYRQALDIYEECGGQHITATALRHLSDAYRAIGDLPKAHEALKRALSILEDLRHTDAEQVRAQLRVLGTGDMG